MTIAMQFGLCAQDLSCRLGGRLIVDAASFRAPSGAITGIIGPNGAGKSTLLRALAGLAPAASGKVQFNEIDLIGMPATKRARILAFVEQESLSDVDLTVEEVVLLGRTPHRSFWGGETRHDREVVSRSLRLAGATQFSRRIYGSLSGGERQRVKLAKAFAQEPQLLLLDEPTNHLDTNAQLAVMDLLRRYADLGMTCLVSLHDLNLAASCCDHLIVLREGEVIAEGGCRDVLTRQLIEDVYQIRAAILEQPFTSRPLIAFASQY